MLCSFITGCSTCYSFIASWIISNTAQYAGHTSLVIVIDVERGGTIYSDVIRSIKGMRRMGKETKVNFFIIMHYIHCFTPLYPPPPSSLSLFSSFSLCFAPLSLLSSLSPSLSIFLFFSFFYTLSFISLPINPSLPSCVSLFCLFLFSLTWHLFLSLQNNVSLSFIRYIHLLSALHSN